MNLTELATVDQVARHAHADPQGVALRHGGSTTTWAELYDRSRRAATRLRGEGVGSGDRVALLVGNTPSFVEHLLAVHLLGAIAVPVNTRLSRPQVEFVLEDTAARVVVTDAERRRTIHGVGFTTVDDTAADASEPIATETLPHAHADDVAYLLYTSGTTGRPKGAMLTHGNLAAASWISTTMNGLQGRGDVRYVATPLFHVAALSSVVGGLLMGATAVIASGSSFDAEVLLDVLETERVTHLFLVPTQWQSVLDSPTLARRQLRVRAIAWGAAPLSPTVLARLTAAFPGVRVMSTFGQTEMSGVTAFVEGLPSGDREGTVGPPAFCVDVRVVDPQMRDVAPGEIGEIVYRGPTTMVGYWKREDATAEAFRGGWFHSGDLVRRDPDGHLYVVDRLKDMIISGGENIYPAELEEVIARHPLVREVTVVGAPHPTWGETPVAFVVPTDLDAPPTHDQVVAWVRDRLASYAKPSATHVVAELPRNATGKVLKGQVRDLATTLSVPSATRLTTSTNS